MNTADEKDFGVDVEVANEEADVDIGFENVRKGIAVVLFVIIFEKLYLVVDWIQAGGCWLFNSRLKKVRAMLLRKNGATARSTTVPRFDTHVIK